MNVWRTLNANLTRNQGIFDFFFIFKRMVSDIMNADATKAFRGMVLIVLSLPPLMKLFHVHLSKKIHNERNAWMLSSNLKRLQYASIKFAEI